MKLQPLLQQNFMTPFHHQYTLFLKQAKIVLKLAFFNKINILSVVILSTFWSSKFYDPLFFFPRIYDRQCILPKKMIASFNLIAQYMKQA